MAYHSSAASCTRAATRVRMVLWSWRRRQRASVQSAAAAGAEKGAIRLSWAWPRRQHRDADVVANSPGRRLKRSAAKAAGIWHSTRCQGRAGCVQDREGGSCGPRVEACARGRGRLTTHKAESVACGIRAGIGRSFGRSVSRAWGSAEPESRHHQTDWLELGRHAPLECNGCAAAGP